MQEPASQRILITGIPGTGKTTIGAYLAAQHRFEHLDFEREGDMRRFLRRGKRGLFEELARIEQRSPNVVLSWGVLPETQLLLVLALREHGYDWLWFDGNRDAARDAFVARGSSSERTFDIQMRAIEEYLDLEQLRPRIINPFDLHGRFRPLAEIAEDVLRI